MDIFLTTSSKPSLQNRKRPTMYRFSSLLFLFISLSCQSQQTKVGGPCQGCEAIYEYGNKSLNNIDTLPAFGTNPKLKLTGTVYKSDGKTPASGVILYIYHTNREGIYPTKGNEEGWGQKHGFIRGWVKTDEKGSYTFYTFRPAAYPNRRAAEHVHITVKEPNKNEYYIDDFFFSDDPLLTKSVRDRLPERGGSGVLNLVKEGQFYIGKRDIILGKNIPNYEG